MKRMVDENVTNFMKTRTKAVILKLGGVRRSGARNNYRNAPKLNYHPMKLSI
jgi:hypothetical protein